MRDYRASVERIRRDAEDAAVIRDLSVDMTKRNIFARLHEHLTLLANEVEQAVSKMAAIPKE